MPGSISPFFRSPVTDITGGMISHQVLGRCAKQEMEYYDCIEAYGWDRGMRKTACIALFEEYRECQTMMKQMLRFRAMRNERTRQIRAGKLRGDEKFLNPELDSY